jgi:hypothetical protein
MTIRSRLLLFSRGRERQFGGGARLLIRWVVSCQKSGDRCQIVVTDLGLAKLGHNRNALPHNSLDESRHEIGPLVQDRRNVGGPIFDL